MGKIKFLPSGQEIDVNPQVKILAAAIRHKIPIRYGCASCQCGTCGVAVDSTQGVLNEMAEDEKKLLFRLSLPTDGSKRLACRAKLIDGQITVDLDFQNEYDPDQKLPE